MRISVIIPVVDEEHNLAELIPLCFQFGGSDLLEVIVVDGGSKDNTVAVSTKMGATVLQCKVRSRAVQMNLGAKNAEGDILYFVHADSRVLPTFSEDILAALRHGKTAGCYAYLFDSDKLLLKINSWFTKFNGILSGGGDQTLFIKKDIFNELMGFDERYCIMEDFELVRRIKKKHSFYVIPKQITVSARKYQKNSWLKVQLSNLTVFTLFFIGIPPKTLKTFYSKILINR